MHICLICNEYPLLTKGGGIGVFTKILADYFIKNENEVTVIGVYKNIKKKKITYDGFIKIICYPFYNIPRFSWEFNRWILCRLIEREHRKQKFDIIEFPDYQGWLRKLNINIPILIRLNAPEKVGLADDIDSNNLNYTIKSEATSINFANYIIGSSLSVIDAAKATYVNPLSKYERIELIYNGIEIPKVIEESKLHHKNQNIVLFAGRLIKKKGVYDLIKAWKIISEKHHNYELMIVGRDGKNELGKSVYLDLKKSIKKNSINNIVFSDQVSLKELRKLFLVSKICVFPSHTEAFSMVVLDALAHGKPTIYTNIGPGREIIAHGENGLLCEPKNSNSLAKNILELIENKKLSKSLSINSINTIKNKFSIQRTGKQNLLYYKKCIDNFKNKK
jgi:glycosyltransferase involved in cell wall biosynthesis